MFKYCPNCKTKLVHKIDRLINCKNCGFHFYLNPALTNALILENEKKEILLVKRKFPPKKNYWDLPGGFVEFGETAEESMIREIEEELKIKPNRIIYLSSYPDRYFYRNINYHTLCFFYTAKITNDQIKDLRSCDDISGFIFFSNDKIPWDKLAFEGLKKTIKNYLRPPVQ